MDEIWKDIPDFEGYQVSTHGRVKHLARPGLHNRWKTPLVYPEKILTPWKTSTAGNYRSVSLYKDGKSYKFPVHRLVAFCFIPNPNGHEDVDHDDRNPSNNRVSNLRWVSTEINLRNSRAHRDSTSKYLGVCTTKNGKWRATINIKDKQIHIGSSKSEDEANLIRCRYEYARRNELNLSKCRIEELEKYLF